MHIEIVEQNEKRIAVVTGSKVITDVQSALDLVMTLRYTYDTDTMAIDKKAVAEAFFILSSGLAGEILEKFVTYHVRVAFFGDFTRYTSKPLHDFIYESNQGKTVFFMPTKEEAVAKLAE